ncbi:hypothetical protein GJU39_18910 [Pedobacter petrophilus]|uniref:Secretory protein n=1 Tax=Pedobacter petrophilus TaxID=1908241 RepID=A0A7K0G426_9SPHI|nr:hypothetical protein [Pedobacter petrophilus]MRX78154.1 hypothetical protein [Pedobacter petrophilus]
MKIKNKRLALIVSCLWIVIASLSSCSKDAVEPDQKTSTLTTTAAAKDTFKAVSQLKTQSTIVAAYRETYQGFKLEYDATANTTAIKNAAHHQLDIIVKSGLKTGLTNMRTITAIRFYSDGTDNILYSGGVVNINNLNVFINIDKDGGTVLFHELSHYLNDKFVSGGIGNSRLVTLYNAAVSSKKYPANAYSMANVAEYFAEDMCAYFPGQKNSAPATKAQLVAWDPNMASYIQSLNF